MHVHAAGTGSSSLTVHHNGEEKGRGPELGSVAAASWPQTRGFFINDSWSHVRSSELIASSFRAALGSSSTQSGSIKSIDHLYDREEHGGSAGPFMWMFGHLTRTACMCYLSERGPGKSRAQHVGSVHPGSQAAFNNTGPSVFPSLLAPNSAQNILQQVIISQDINGLDTS